MSEKRRQGLVLAALVVLFAVVLWWRLGGVGGGGRASAIAALTRGSAQAESTYSGAEIKNLQLRRLEHKPGHFSPGRDPFRFAPAPQAKPQPPRRPPPKEVLPPRPAPPRNVGPPKPQPPPLRMKFLGSFGPQASRIAVFKQGDEIYNAFAGDVLEEKFIVDKIGFESADIKFVGFPDVPAKRLAAGG